MESYEEDQPQSIPPAKRQRTTFTSFQLQQMEKEFERSQHMGRLDRYKLALRLSLGEKQVKLWFQNRRSKAKKKMKKAGLCKGVTDTTKPLNEQKKLHLAHHDISYSQIPVSQDKETPPLNNAFVTENITVPMNAKVYQIASPIFLNKPNISQPLENKREDDKFDPNKEALSLYENTASNLNRNFVPTIGQREEKNTLPYAEPVLQAAEKRSYNEAFSAENTAMLENTQFDIIQDLPIFHKDDLVNMNEDLKSMCEKYLPSNYDPVPKLRNVQFDVTEDPLGFNEDDLVHNLTNPTTELAISV